MASWNETLRILDGTMDQFPRLEAMRLRRDQREREGQLYKYHEDMAIAAARRARQAEVALEGATKYLQSDISKHMNGMMAHKISDFVYCLIMEAASNHYRDNGAEGLLTIEMPAEWLRMMDRDSLQKRVYDYYMERYVRQMDARFAVPEFGTDPIMEHCLVVEIQVPEARYRQHLTSWDLGIR